MSELDDEGTGGAGGLGNILGGLAGGSSGLADVVERLVGTGNTVNARISADDVRRVIGEDELARIASELGVSEREAADAVVRALSTDEIRRGPQ